MHEREECEVVYKTKTDMKILRTICMAAMALILAFGQLSAQQTRHTVQAGQNLYRIAMKYGVTVQAIIEANPNISEDHVPAGMTLVIPQATKEPIVDALEQIPLPPALAEEHNKPSQTSDWGASSDNHWTDGVLNLSVILPFNLNASTVDENKAQMRYVEFYEGVLMAVDEMQQSGRRVKVQTYDLSTESLCSLLFSREMQQADLVITSSKAEELRQVVEWSDMSGTPVVSPFDFNNSMVGMYKHLFQVNSPKSMFYPQLTEELIQRFTDYTFIFLTDSVGNRKADSYPLELKQALSRRRIPYRELSYLSPERLMACDSILGLKDENLLFVPVTPQPEAMRRMFSGLQHVKILRDARYEQAVSEGHAPAGGQPQLAVLGYPEWVLNTQEFINYYYDLNVYMFSKFYANPFDSKLKTFYSEFKQWYGKEPMALAPKYALLGYDIAHTFLHALAQNGQHLEERIVGDVSDGLQTVFCFDNGGGKGYYNRGAYLVHFTPESTIEKIVLR